MLDYQFTETNNTQKPTTAIAASLLRVIGVILITPAIFVIAITLIGDLTITTNPDTGEAINGASKIIPDLLREWWAFALFAIGVIFLCISHSYFKDKKPKSEPEAKILTMEEVKEDTSTEDNNEQK